MSLPIDVTLCSFYCQEENVAVLKQLADKTSEAEDLRQACDNVTRKLHVREKYASDVEDDNSKLAEALQLGKVELEQVCHLEMICRTTGEFL